MTRAEDRARYFGVDPDNLHPYATDYPQRQSTIPPAIRAELDRTQAWWQSEYNKLLAATFRPVPFIESEHEGHQLVAVGTYTRAPRLFCTTCPPVWKPKPKEATE